MPHYRLYFFNGVGHIHGLHEYEAADDRDAIAQGALRQGLGAMELWSGMRKVKRWDRLSSCSPSPMPPHRPLSPI